MSKMSENRFNYWLIVGILAVPFVYSLECYKCDSLEDSECATHPGQQLEVEECSNTNDECVTDIVAGHTRRGCLSRLYPNNYCADPCDRCTTSLCNRNVFPANRLRCFQCLGSDCVIVQNKTDLILPCPIYDENDRCYTNIIQEKTVQRGCVYTNLPSTCPNICLKCNYDGCNNEPGVHEDSCIKCESTRYSPNPYCLRDVQPVMPGRRCTISAQIGQQMNVKTCTNKLLYGHKGKCYSYFNEQTQLYQRGCSISKPFFESGHLSECYGENCNNACFPISCSSCKATAINENMQCRRGENLRFQSCGNDTFSCFACETASTLRRGCRNSSFVQAQNEACYYCSNAEDCNSKLPLRTCYHCSSRDVESCANASWDSTAAARKRICSSQTELCVSTVSNKYNMVFVVRGCASNIAECSEFDPYCVRCNGSLCNNVPIELESIIRTMNLKFSDRNGVGCQSKLYRIGLIFIMTLIINTFYVYLLNAKS